MSEPAPKKTRSDLEWPRVLAALASRCATDQGRERARALPFPADHAGAREALREAEEARRLLDGGAPLPLSELPDVSDCLARARAHGVLGPAELRAVARMLAQARSLRRFLQAHRGDAPALHAACSTDPTLDTTHDAIDAAFDADGTLADRASPELARLRAEHRAARTRILSRIEELMSRYDAILQDRFVTEREGRWVVPVRSDAHERFPGIVHGSSQSGATLFVEPRAVVSLGNRLKVLDAEVAREEHAVYARLTEALAFVLPSAEAACDAVARADLRAATAQLSVDAKLSFPELRDEPVLDLVSARHPLLALDLDEGAVVPSDLTLAAGTAMVVSGPNAGGKTVALKTLGLVALMARAGLPVPCRDDSKVGLFDVVLTDVGDDQSLQKNLSTFSAHVTNLVHTLGEAQRGALVLLDELAGGTDPREGEALAAAVLDALVARGAAVAATTHYEGLKALALSDPRFANASCGFDLPTMTPTFRVTRGVPGASSALAVARRFGMPAAVLARAERFLTREDMSFETLVRRLESERAALELARSDAERREHEAAHARERLEAEIERVRSGEQRVLTREIEDLSAKVRRAREELSQARQKLRGKVDPVEVRTAADAIDRVAAEVALGGDLERDGRRTEVATAPLRATDVRKGTRVYVPRLRADAEVVEVQGDHARVAAGPLKLTVAIADLRAPAAAPKPTGSRRPAAPTGAGVATSSLEAPMATTESTCDLRGLRADDAIALSTSFLDRALHAGLPAVWLIHGHGSGALRAAVREELARSPYVARFRPGETGEGGDGVTVAWLKT